MRLRKLSVVVLAAAVSVTGLAGCRTNVGTAARVGSMRISESDVNRYVTPKGPSSAVVAQARQQGQDVVPKSEVLQYLIQEQLFRSTLAKNGGVPDAGALAASQREAFAVLLNAQEAPSAVRKQLTSSITQSGVRSSFTSHVVTALTLEYALIKRANLRQFPQLAALVNKTRVAVSVSPRYGKWDRANLSINRAAGVPSFLKLQPTPGAQNAAANPLPGGGS